MGERSDGQWSTPRVGLAVPRQNGKGALIEARELAGLLVFGEQSIVHSAHEQKTARIGFDRIRSYFDNYDDLRRKVKAIGTAVAREYIELTSGQVLRFPARSKGAIRGFSIDCLILDEAQEFSDLALQAVMPTLAARPNPQMWLLGTPPSPANDGEVFTRWRNAGHEGSDRRLCWCEWSADPAADMDAPETWESANPALGIRIGYEAVSDERAALDDEGFGRERLGIWDSARDSGVIPAQSWADCEDRLSVPVGQFTLGVECGPDLGWASVALAGQRDDLDWHVALEDDQHTKGRGVDWLVPALTDVLAKNPQLRGPVADVGGPIKAMLEQRSGRYYFRGARLEVAPLKVSDLGGACSTLLSLVITGGVKHIGQPQFTAAALAAGKRALGDTGLWVWQRKNATSDITPAQAATYALWGAQNLKARQWAASGARGWVG